MLTRRTRTRLSAQDTLNAVLSAPMGWPGKTVWLEKTAITEYRQRSMSPYPAAAELYHENSKLFRENVSELSIDGREAAELRAEFVMRRALVVRSSGASICDLASPWRDVLQSLARVDDPALFYSLDLRVLACDWIGNYDPVANILQLVKQPREEDLVLLDQGLRLCTDLPGRWQERGAILLILGSFARNEILLGKRGYRRTLIECGMVAQWILAEAKRLGVTATPLHEFADRSVDSVLEADGIEQSTLMAIGLN
jgi:hypothetical protein